MFDLDDTLFPEIDFVFSGYRAAAEKAFDDFGVDIEPRLREKFLNGKRGDLFTPALREAGVDAGEPYVKTLVEAYRSHRPTLSLFVDAEALIHLLNKQGRSIGLITDGWEEVQARKIRSLGLQERVDSVVRTDALGGREAWKPNVVGYRECLRKLSASPSDTVFVGDNPEKDFLGAKKAGIESVRIRRPVTEHGDKQVLDEKKADVSVKSMRKLYKKIE